MPVTVAEKKITGEELARMGDIGPCELVDGRIVPMPPTGDAHGGVELRFGQALDAHVTPRRLGKVRVGEVGIYIAFDPDRVRAADALYISADRHARRSRERAFLDVAPEIVVEVLSPEDRAIDLHRKLGDYFSIGVKLVWVADPEVRVVHAYRTLTDVRAFGAGDTLTAEEILPGLAVPVDSLFED
jgi:Uma2 family endonuclease